MKFHVPTVLAFFGAWASVIAPLGGLSLWLADRAREDALAVESRLRDQIATAEGRLGKQVDAVESRMKAQVSAARDSVGALSFRLNGVAKDAAYIKGHLRMTRAVPPEEPNR